jgi:hypothetical protein
MASNDQILAALAKMSESIADLRVEVSAIPEIKERTDELVRVLKGHNGNDGLVTRVKIQEMILGKHLKDAECMRTDLTIGIEDIRSALADHKNLSSEGTISELKDHIKKQNDRVIDQAIEIQGEERSERRDERKDSRKFRYDLALAVLLMLANLIFGILSQIQISNLANMIP